MDIKKIAAGLELDDDQTLKIEQGAETVAALGNDPVIRELCGKSLSLAVLPGESEVVVDHEKHLLPVQLLLIARPEHKAELLELMSQAFTGEVKEDVIPYGKSEIVQFTVDGTTFFAAVTDGLFVFALNRKTVEATLDLQGNSQGALVALAAFAELKQQLPAVEFLAFSAPENLAAAMAATVQGERSDDKLAGLRYSIYGIWKEGTGFKDRTVTLIDRSGLIRCSPGSWRPRLRTMIPSPSSLPGFRSTPGRTPWPSMPSGRVSRRKEVRMGLQPSHSLADSER